MTGMTEWQGRVGRSWANEWRRTDRSFSALTPRLLDAALAEPFTSALDIGCGAGEVSLALAEARPTSAVIGVDVGEDLLAVARERGGDVGNAAFEHGDAATWSPADFAPDLLVSRHGVMFFDDPVRAFTHLGARAASNARLVFTCFRSASENAWAQGLANLLPGEGDAPSQPGEPGPFAFADKGYVRTMLMHAGWSEVAFEPIDFPYLAGSGADPVGDAMSYFLVIGPAARAATQLDDRQRPGFLARLREFLTNHACGDRVELGAAVWLVSARAP